MVVALIGIGVSDMHAETNMPSSEISKNLNLLIEQSIDGQKGYQDAANDITSKKLQDRFAKESSKRQEFAETLQQKVSSLGKDFNTQGTVTGSLHRGWMGFKTAMIGQSVDDATVLGAVKTGESTALKVYEDVLAKGLPKDLDKIIKQQKDELQKACDRIDKELGKIKTEKKP